MCIRDRWLDGHSAAVICCAFSPDGKRILSGSIDGSLYLWDSESGQPIGFRIQQSQDAHVVLRVEDDVLMEVSEEAWRYLGWQVMEPGQGMVRYPAETYGDLLP